MNQRDLNVVNGAFKGPAATTCLLTGRSGSVMPVTLRRMLIIPPLIWIGWRSVVLLPPEKKQHWLSGSICECFGRWSS